MQILINLLVSAVAVFASAYILPQVTVDSPMTAVWVAIALGVANTTIKPILSFLALPITIITLGLFSFVIQLVILWLVTLVIPGFAIAGILGYILFAVVLSIISGILSAIVK